MPSPSHEAYRNLLLGWFRKHAQDAGVARSLERYAEQAAVLWELDLEPARPILMQGYAKKPRGGRPWDPLVLLRCLLLPALLAKNKINAWVPDMRACTTLLVLCGVNPDDVDCTRRDGPGVGTLYDFMHRLHNGRVRDCACGCRVSPATIERKRAATPQPKNKKPRRKETKAQKKARRRKRAASDPAAKPVSVEPSATRALVKKLKAEATKLTYNDLLERLALMLLDLGVVNSAQKGLLGDITQITAAGDGSPLLTGASKHAKRSCDCAKDARCECNRVYQDPDAAFGYDAYRERYFYGHHIYEITACADGHDLPLHLRLDPGNESDFTASLSALDRLCKLLRTRHPEMNIRYLLLDAGHDGQRNYRFVMDQGIIPVIPLARHAPVQHPQRPGLFLSKRGVPLCPGGCEMAPWGSAKANRRLFVCPVKAGFEAQCPLAPDDDPDWRCKPGTAMAPVINLSIEQNPRLCPPVPRNSRTHKQLYNRRSACERSFSVKKTTMDLEGARHRRKSFWLIRVYLMAVLQHAKAWVADTAPMALVDHLLGRQHVTAAAS